MKQTVLTWLRSGANAGEGVQLLIGAGAPSRVIRLCRLNPSANLKLMVNWLCAKYNIDEDYSYVNTAQSVLFTERKTTSFRDEFPFLNDPGCPPEYEILASRKFARYHAYVDLHKKLPNCTSIAECASVSHDIIVNYIENRMIWDELNYYQKHRQIYGRHPIFAAYRRRKDLLAMSVKELMIRQRRLRGNIWRIRDELKKGDKPHLDIERRSRLQTYESELAEINGMLGDNG